MEVDPNPAGHEGRAIRVAMLAACAFPANHGTPGAIRELSLHLAEHGDHVHVITYPQSEDIAIGELKVSRVRLPFERLSPLGIGPSFKRVLYDMLLIPKIVSVVSSDKLNVIHAHNYEACIAATIARLVTGTPVIYNGVTAMADELPTYGIGPKWFSRWLGRVLDHIVPRLSDFILVLSDELKDYLVGIGIDRNKVLVVPPGVEIDWLCSGDGSRSRTRLGIPEAARVVLYTGALERFQRLDYLVRAMVEVVSEEPDALLVIACNVENPDAARRYQQLGDSLGIGEHLMIVPHVPLADLPDVLGMADVAVVPRPSCPGYPIKLLNYMAAARAVVSFEGSAKSLYHGFSGYVAKDHDVSDLAAGIIMFLKDPELANLVGKRAQASLKGAFDWGSIATGISEVYKRAIVDRRRVLASDFGEYFCASYRPQLLEAVRVSSFRQDGILSYPSLIDGDGEDQ